MKRIKIIILLSFVLLSNSLFATVQRRDIFIMSGDTMSVYRSFPLEQYFEQKGERTIGGVQMQFISTAVRRGYIATWKLENDSLFLTHIYTGHHNVCIKDEFASDRVFAEWVNEPIIVISQVVHRRWRSFYVQKHFAFENGRLKDVRIARARVRRR